MKSLRLWRSLRRHSIKVPDDISLVGFDDREEPADGPASLDRPRPQRRDRRNLHEMLLERLHHPRMTFSQRILPPNL